MKPEEAKDLIAKRGRLTRSEFRVLRRLANGLDLDLAEDWVDVLALHGAGLIRLRKLANGQLAIEGLTAEGADLYALGAVVSGLTKGAKP